MFQSCCRFEKKTPYPGSWHTAFLHTGRIGCPSTSGFLGALDSQIVAYPWVSQTLMVAKSPLKDVNSCKKVKLNGFCKELRSAEMNQVLKNDHFDVII